MGRDDHDWASRDIRWMFGAVVLLFLGAVHVVFIWLLLVLLVTAAVVLAVRAERRRRRLRNAPVADFWLDRMGDDPRRRYVTTARRPRRTPPNTQPPER